MNEALAALHQLTSRFHPLQRAEWDAFAAIWSPVSAKRKEQLTLAGEPERFIYFVLSGIQRVYFSDGAKEATLVFTYTHSFGGVLDSLLMQQPSRYYYETLSPSEFLRARQADLLALMADHRSLETLVRKGVTWSMSGIMERLVELECFSAEERFRTLLKRSPHILQLIPHKYLANYLGMEATNFSKLLNSVRI